MTSPNYRICVRCVMDTSDPAITFDAEGRCCYCTDFFARKAQNIRRGPEAERELEAMVRTIRSSTRSSDYDCVLGISGGTDSCYAAYVAKSAGLRPLAVHLDNGWNSDIAVKNIRRVTSKLGIDYQSYVLDWEEFKDLQLAFLRASVTEIETPTDIAIPAALHRVAAEHGVKYILSGGNTATEGILPKAFHYNAKDTRYLRAVHRRFGTRPLKTFPTFGFLTEAYYKLVKGIRFFYLLDCVPYDKKEANALLREKFGWQDYGGKHFESKITGFVQSYVFPTKFGLDYRRPTLSTQICVGSVGRDEALEELKKLPYDTAKLPADKEYIAKKFGITLAELEAILAEPAKTYRDYPNDERLLNALYGVYRRASPLLRRVR
jgi:N-acetyl sugar amidotransferase